MNLEPTEYDMLISDELGLFQEIEEHKMILIELEKELQFTRNKLEFIKRAVPESILLSAYD